MLAEHSWPNAILHMDGDGFFASCFESIYPELKGKPIVVGKERGMVIALSYEAKKYGIKRCISIDQALKLCPECVALDSDFKLYNLISQRMFTILRQYTPLVDEYSIDEGFADIKGLRRPLKMTYHQMGAKIKDQVEGELGISVSIGISATKSLAKLASNFRKPSGLTVVPGKYVSKLLQLTHIENVWGIGSQTSSFLRKNNIKTAFDYVEQPESFIKKYMSKPYQEIWMELQGHQMNKINPNSKNVYKGMADTKTFTPPTNDSRILWSKLLLHIEESFTRARRFQYKVKEISIFLKTQRFEYHQTTIKLANSVAYPHLIYDEIKKAFDLIYKKGTLYRATGCTISHFEELQTTQGTLFNDDKKESQIKKIYSLYEQRKVDFGFTLYDPDKDIEIRKSRKFFLPKLSVGEV